jgi:phage shock protein C
MSAQGGETPRRLYRSMKERKLGGVCGGIADYFNVDPVIVRLAWVAITILSLGVGILLYLIAVFVVPNNPHQPGHSPA